MCKLILLCLSGVFFSLGAFADSNCSLPLNAAQDVARLYILDNEAKIAEVASFQNLKEFAKNAVEQYTFSPDGRWAGYTFEIATYKSTHQLFEAWIHVTCDANAYLIFQYQD